MEAKLGIRLSHAATGFPPGVPPAERQATANVVEAADGLQTPYRRTNRTTTFWVCKMALSWILGGGTTGVAIVEDGKVVYSADEATGGTHMSLVIAGANQIPFEDAEALKQDPAEQTASFLSFVQ